MKTKVENSGTETASPIEAQSMDLLVVLEEIVEHRFAINDGVRIHYAAAGAGPLLVFIHGFPDHWLGWWQQMSELCGSYRVVAMDMRGYNLSDKPDFPEAYETSKLVADVRAVIMAEGTERATIIGHDWGGFVAWHTAMDAPDLVERLIVLNMAHPWAISRDLANSALQRKASEYVRLFRHPQAHTQIPLARLSSWVKESPYKTRHDRAMAVSSLEGMLSIYRMNWPTEPYKEISFEPPHVKVPTLLIHGLDDAYVLPICLNDVWKWVDNEVTILTLPNVGHFAQHDCPQRITHAIRKWLRDKA